jgi:cation diffusion facilitator CzcD-associated flavoprotein CzcO
MVFKVDSIAIIGAGPSGLAALYEFLHTSKQGVSSFGSKEPEEKAFEEIVVFEQKSNPGGVWAVPDEEKVSYLKDLYQYDSLQNILDSKEKSLQSAIRSYNSRIPLEVNKSDDSVSWKGTPLHKNLFTNIPKRFTRFSTSAYKAIGNGRPIDPFLRDFELRSHIQNYVSEHDLEKHIKFNTEVVKAVKKGDKWLLTLKYEDKDTDKKEFYLKEFDAIVVANGSYTLPYIPQIEGLKEYEEAHPGSILHSKFFRDYEDYRNQKIIILGSSVSGLALSQYLKPLAKEFILSRKNRKEILDWMNDIIYSKEVTVKSPIKRFIPSSKEIWFDDGTRAKDFDKILLATGYYPYYPFFEKGFLSLSVPPEKKGPANNSRIKNLYYNIFKIDDPTLAFVGLIKTSQLFTGFESQSAAVAGIWSNAKQLPSLKEQYDWELKKLEETPDTSRFYVFSNEDVETKYFDRIKDFFPFARKYPLDENYYEHFEDFKIGEQKLADLSLSIIRKKVVFENGEYIVK